MMEYKGYIGTVAFDAEADLFCGEVINIRDVVTFQGRSVDEIRQAFRESVEDYLAFCAKRGEPADKPFSGKLMVRLTPELHRRLFIRAKRDGKSLNAWIADCIEKHTAGDVGSVG
jgi:predicted HicB family RNase H-like nuclease